MRAMKSALERLAITIQAGFMMPPSGFAICFFSSVAPSEVKTTEIYAGVAPILVAQPG
jgi:TRAP-type mannitol/chloroaromatic compound transport system permease large subunit